MMNSKVIGMLIVVLVIVAGAVMLLQNNSNTNSPAANQDEQITTSPTEMMEASPVAEEDADTTGGEVKEFTITASSFRYAPAAMSVKKGDTVKILIKNSGGMHDFVIDELGVKTPVIQDGEDTSVEFVAKEAGEFEYYCSVGNHRQQGMVGTLTVTE